jgi:hypothetical protein
MRRRNKAATVRLQLSVDPTTNDVLEDLASLGVFAKNRAEVATAILSQWVWENEEKLARRGIELPRKRSNRSGSSPNLDG